MEKKEKKTHTWKERGEREEEGRGLATETRVGTSRWKSISKSPERERTTPTDAPPLPRLYVNSTAQIYWTGSAQASSPFWFPYIALYSISHQIHPPPPQSTSKSIQMRFNVAPPPNNLLFKWYCIYRLKRNCCGRHLERERDITGPAWWWYAQLSPVSSSSSSFFCPIDIC